MSKETDDTETEREPITLNYDLGDFEGFNHEHQRPICPNPTAEQVVNWDHDTQGEAEFWPSGDNTGVKLCLPGSSVTGSQIVALDNALEDFGGDTPENYAKIAYMIDNLHYAIEDVTESAFKHDCPQVCCGSLEEVAHDLFETYYPAAFKVWEEGHCPGLSFDWEDFMRHGFSTSEYTIDGETFIIVTPQ